jgi:hypothetical protein
MNSHITIVNNVSQNLSIVHDMLIDYAKTGVINEDIEDIFELERFEKDGLIKIIVNFKED